MRVPDAGQIAAFLLRLGASVADGRVEIRGYALDGLRELEWTAQDLRLQLLELSADDLFRTEESTAVEGGLIWVFTPEFWDGGYLWLRLIERGGIVVISLHKG